MKSELSDLGWRMTKVGRISYVPRESFIKWQGILSIAEKHCYQNWAENIPGRPGMLATGFVKKSSQDPEGDFIKRFPEMWARTMRLTLFAVNMLNYYMFSPTEIALSKRLLELLGEKIVGLFKNVKGIFYKLADQEDPYNG